MAKIEAADIEAHVDDVDVIVRACAMIAKALWGEHWAAQRLKPQRLDSVRRAMATLPPSIVAPIGLYEEHVASLASRHESIVRQFVGTEGRAVRPLLDLAGDIVRHHQLDHFADVGAFVDCMPALRRRVLRELAKLPESAAAATSRPESNRHKTSLDDRACELMKRWQHDDTKCDRWTIDQLAGALGTKRANLLGQQRGKRRCPKFFEAWNLLRAARGEAKRLPEVPRARPRTRA